MTKKIFEHVAMNENNPDFQKAISRLKPLYQRSNDLRSEFGRDYTRIIFSLAYRRLKHKTQVFFAVKDDHVCTRSEHVNLVESISYTIANYLGLNTELTKAIAVGHDLGHAPFGHGGERIIDEIAKQVVKTPGVWPLLSKFSNDFPFLLFSLRFYYPHMLQCDQDKCIQLLYHAILTDPTAANIINKLYPLLPKSFPAILNCSLYGPISLRTAARVCISDDSMWSQLILFHSMHGNTMEIFKNIIADIIDSGDKLTALHLFNIFIEIR